MTRTDTHSPTNFDPSEYREIGYFDAHPEDGCEWHSREPEDQTDGEFDGNYTARGRCDHCGAGPLRYGIVFKHLPTGLAVVVGDACATKLALNSRGAVELRALAQESARKIKLDEFLATLDDEQRAAITWAHDVCVTPYVDEDGSKPFAAKFPGLQGETVAFISDISSKLHRYGSLSEKQVGALVKVKTRIEGYAARNAEERAALTTPLAEDRYEITGTVVSIKSGENDYGYWEKMLVRMADGNKVYGTVPSSISPERGDTVKFSGKVERSKDDEHFGFFSRPTKAEIVERAPVQA